MWHWVYYQKVSAATCGIILRVLLDCVDYWHSSARSWFIELLRIATAGVEPHL